MSVSEKRPLIDKYTRHDVASTSSSSSLSASTTTTSMPRRGPPTPAETRPYPTQDRRPSTVSLTSVRLTKNVVGDSSFSKENFFTKDKSIESKAKGTTSESWKKSVGKDKMISARTSSISSSSLPTSDPLNDSQSSESSRQWSADSGVGVDSNNEEDSEDSKFVLPPRITKYGHSEAFLMSLPRCDQFVTHMARNLRPMLASLAFSNDTATSDASDQVKKLAPALHRLTQELFVAFPHSKRESETFNLFLRISIENVVMRFVHDRIFPLICALSRSEDLEVLRLTQKLHSSNFSSERLGLPEDLCVPLTASVVELAALDMHTTPLDRLTVVYDAVEQIRVHIQEAFASAHPDQSEKSCEAKLDRSDLVLLLATIIVEARPLHLMSTLNYADLFAWTVPIDIIEVVTLVSDAADLLRNIEPGSLQPASGKLKREVSMEEIFQLTDELEQSFDRRGRRREPLRSALDLHRERFTQRMEQSAEERTRRQDEAWANIDEEGIKEQQERNSRLFKRGLLASLHSRLLCNSEPQNQNRRPATK